MNKSRYILSTIFLAAAFAVTEYVSAEEEVEIVGRIERYVMTKEGDSCFASSSFDNDKLGLTFGILEDGDPVIIVINNSWKLPAGINGTISFKVDSKVDRVSDAFSADGYENTIGVRANFEFFKQVAQGKSLTVEAGTWRHVFPLEGTSAALKGLVRCTAHVKRQEASNPFVEEAVKEASNPFVDL